MANLAEEVAGYHWHHSIDLGQGVVTPGTKSTAMLADEVRRIFDPVDLAGRSVIDIGAWNGFFSFEAKRRGAARVLATDSFVWTFPGIRGRETFDLARDALNLNIEARLVDVMDLTPEIGQFDVTLFLGVFYHLADPIRGLERAASVTKDLLIVETHMDAIETNWWGPNIACMAGLLRMVGFPVIYFQQHPHELGRGVFHAFRSAELAVQYAARQTPSWRDISTDNDAETARKVLVEALEERRTRNTPSRWHRLLHKLKGR
jgi:tRNA (mo5U34)-methyltransferase